MYDLIDTINQLMKVKNAFNIGIKESKSLCDIELVQLNKLSR